MTKEEKIKEVYKGYKGIIDEKGYTNFMALEYFGKHNLDSKVKGDKLLYRPKSLQGIETNNNWIKIESEKDLPINTMFMECISKSFDFNDPRSQCTHHYTLGNSDYVLRNYSHYRQIPFNPPIY